MPQRNRVTDMDFDEVSTVDIPANQHGLIVLAKSAGNQEDIVADFADEQGNPIEGQLVQFEGDDSVFLQTEDGQLYVVDPDDLGDVYDGEQERELAEVGKSAFLDQLDNAAGEYYGSLSEELAKALNDAGRDDVLAKAFAAQRAELAKAQAETERALEIAKAVQEREQERLFITKAADYDHTGVDPEVLGPVLMRMSKSMSYEDCAVVAGILERQGDIFKQFGVPGGQDLDDPLAEVEAYANEHAGELAKSYNYGEGRSELSKEQASVAFFDSNPRAYSELKRGIR